MNGPNNAVIRSYIWGLDLSGMLQGAGGIGGLLTINAQTDGVHYVGYDGNGNVSALASAVNGTRTATCEYSPFDQLLVADGIMARKQPFRFSTKYHDEETGTLYYGYRDLDVDTGRWLSRDPNEEFAGVALYVFNWNDPETNVDPEGLAPVPGGVGVNRYPPGWEPGDYRSIWPGLDWSTGVFRGADGRFAPRPPPPPPGQPSEPTVVEASERAAW